MTILIVGDFRPGSLEEIYFSAFKLLGLKVSRFDILQKVQEKNSSIFRKILHRVNQRLLDPLAFSYSEANQDLIKLVKTNKPDYIFVFKGLQIFPETISSLKPLIKEIFAFNADHPFKFYTPGVGNKYILDSIPLYDFHLTYSTRIKDQMIGRYNIPCFYLPFGYINYNINNFTISNHNIIFVGSYDKRRAETLSRMNIPNLEIYGTARWVQRTEACNKYLNNAYKGKSIFGADYAGLICSSIGSVNFLREQNMIEESHNMRTFEVPGNGGLLFTNRTEEQMDFFIEDREIVFFDTEDELKDKVLFYSKNLKIAEAIKRNAYKKSITNKYDYNSRALEIVNILKSRK